MMHTLNPSTQETEAGISCVPGYPGLHSERTCLKTKQKEQIKQTNTVAENKNLKGSLRVKKNIK
jgi:hypothetical protein